MRVLQSFPAARATTNPYLVQLRDRLRPHAQVFEFSWRRALTNRYDVFHVHWPETLLHGRTPARSLARRVLFRTLLARLRRRHTAVVRTVHNAHSHEPNPGIEQRLLDRLDRQTVLWIRLNPATPTPTGASVHTIEHGDYREWFARRTLPAPIPGRLLFFGLIRPYKGIDGLVSAFCDLTDSLPPGPGLSLRIVGRPNSPELGAEVLGAAAADPRIGVRLGHASEAALADEVGQAELVVLPYRDMHNSGAALLALSLGRPILVPANVVTEALREEVGGEWVLTYTGALSAAALARGLMRARVPRLSNGPDLSRRDWDDIARRHLDAYSCALREADLWRLSARP
jgi:beta-1,4-mannosyltransferase